MAGSRGVRARGIAAVFNRSFEEHALCYAACGSIPGRIHFASTLRMEVRMFRFTQFTRFKEGP